MTSNRNQILKEMGITQWMLRETEVGIVADDASAQIPNSPVVKEPAKNSPTAVIQIEDVSNSGIDEQADLNALRLSVAACTACSLSQSRNHTVFGEGPEQADWLLVGEAPGQQEDRQGKPFVGRAGQLLTQMIRALDKTREQMFIANTLKCRPPGNRDPLPEELQACEPYLLKQIELIQPKVILALGRISAQALLKSDQPLGQLRGQVYQYGPDKIPLIVTYHPAYLLRNPADKAEVWSDLLLAHKQISE